MRPWSVWIGFDPREAAAFAVCRSSIQSHFKAPIPVRGIVLSDLQKQGLYYRPTERRLGRLYDVLSRRDDYDGAMSTEFAISRFLTPYLAGSGLAIFMDCDMLVRVDLSDVFRECAWGGKAVYCVKHDHRPDSDTKMDGQLQTKYLRKNWSSFMVFDCDHPANKALTVNKVNTMPGRDLHAFKWLDDEAIGELSPEWNWLVGHSSDNIDPKVVHWTDGGPWFDAFKSVPFADEYSEALARWAA